MSRRRGFTLVELMVVVAIVAILAAVALPMYGTFRQKSKVSHAIKASSGVIAALQDWYDKNSSFSSLGVARTGGAIFFNNNVKIGAGLPEIPDLEWTINSTSASVVQINWAFTHGCPSSHCDGYYQMTCNNLNDKCEIVIFLDAADSLGMNKL